MAADTTGTLRHSRRDSKNDEVKRAVLRDCRLSWAARGFYQLLYTLPDGWDFRFSHLVRMSPGGKTQLQGIVLELRIAGALKIEDRRLDAHDAAAKNEELLARGEQPRFRAGNLCGKFWTLVHPDDWAVEFSLDPGRHDTVLLDNFAKRLAAARANKKSTADVHRQPENPPSVKLSSENQPEREFFDLKEYQKEEQRPTPSAVDKFFSGLGLLVENDADQATLGQIFMEFRSRRDFVMNAVASVRARNEKNRPYPSTVLAEARQLKSLEAYNNLLEFDPRYAA